MLQWPVQRAATTRISKAGLSSDRSLQPDSVKLDSLVIAHQPWRGEYVPGPCTHRPSPTPAPVRPSRSWVGLGEGDGGGVLVFGVWSRSVTGSGSGNLCPGSVPTQNQLKLASARVPYSCRAGVCIPAPTHRGFAPSHQTLALAKIYMG